jgi:hypothetical protein
VRARPGQHCGPRADDRHPSRRHGANFDDLLAGDGALAGVDLAKVRQYAADGPQSFGGGYQDAYINGNADQYSQDDLAEALGSDITGLRQAITTSWKATSSSAPPPDSLSPPEPLPPRRAGTARSAGTRLVTGRASAKSFSSS